MVAFYLTSSSDGEIGVSFLHKAHGNYYFMSFCVAIPEDRTGNTQTKKMILFQNKKKKSINWNGASWNGVGELSPST